MDKPKGYVDAEYLRFTAQISAQSENKQRSYALMHLAAGQRVLDVGCGPATDTVPLGKLVGASGEVVGVDYDAEMIEKAEQAAREAGVSGWVRHQRADAGALPLPNDYFDAARSERLFQHLPDPRPALAEMTRVVKPGGWIVVLDTDWGMYAIDSPEAEIGERLRRVKLTEQHNSYSGRTLYRLFRRQGLTEIAVELVSLYGTDLAATRRGTRLDQTEQLALAQGVISVEELARWRDSLERADAEGVFFAMLGQLLVAGRKP